MRRSLLLAGFLIGPVQVVMAADGEDFSKELSEYLTGLPAPKVFEFSNADSPLSAGLPEEISADFLDREGFLAFWEIPEDEARRLRAPRRYVPAPIGAKIRFNGVRVDPMDRPAQRKVFDESVYAMIPPGTKIRVSGAPPREIWDYPVGTTVAHRIALRSIPPRVYELRLVRKMENGRWAYGSYSPADLDDQRSADTLRLNVYPQSPEVSFRLRSEEGSSSGPMTEVVLKRIVLASCRGCHFVNSTADYLYARYLPDGSLDVPASVAFTGPCGFVPNNPSVKGMWAQVYARRNGGRSPFE